MKNRYRLTILTLVGAACLSLPGCGGADTTTNPVSDFPFSPAPVPPAPPPPPVPPAPPPPPVTNGVILQSVSSGGTAGDRDSDIPATAGDGTFVAFQSNALNLVPDKSVNVFLEAYLRNVSTSSMDRVSVDSAGAEANGNSGDTVVSTSGITAFDSDATNLVPGDSNVQVDVFRRAPGQTLRVSVSSAGAQADGFSGNPSISNDGNLVAFDSVATNLVVGDVGGFRDVFVRDVGAGTTVRVSLDSASVPGNGDSGAQRISADGRFVAFASVATNLVPNDTNGVRDVFLRDLAAGTTVRVSVASDGTQGDAASGGSGLVVQRVLDVSDDGRFVVFESNATNLVAGDTNGLTDIFMRDVIAGTTTRVSVTSAGAQADGRSITPKISGDGRFVVFSSVAANLDSRDQNGLSDVFVRDTVTGTTQAFSLNQDVTATANGGSFFPDASADGRVLVFSSDATDLVVGATAGIRNIFSATNPFSP